MRPFPAHARNIHLGEALESGSTYQCIICHNITDLLDVKSLPGPRIIVIHSTLEGRLHEEQSDISPEHLKHLLSHYLHLLGGHAVAISPLKAGSWGLTEDIVTSGVDPKDYLPYHGEMPIGLRIANEISKRKHILLWDFHCEVFRDFPIKIVGYNPDMHGIGPARDWQHLKQTLSSHRFFVHTADPRFEDGFNMATLEAMAAGMPILGNRHPTSPIEHGVNGFMSDNPLELRSYADMLLNDRALAVDMGEKARETVTKRFPLSKFKKSFISSIEIAHRNWESKSIDLGIFQTGINSSHNTGRLPDCSRTT